MTTKIKRGDSIVFKPEWQDKGDDLKTFIAVQDENEKRRFNRCGGAARNAD